MRRLNTGRQQTVLSRKGFLKLAGLAGMAGSLPHRFFSVEIPTDWPAIHAHQLPVQMRAILALVPRLVVDPRGNLVHTRGQDHSLRQVPFAQTQWNREHSHPWDRLDAGVDWGIVMHWYGDEPGYNRTVEGYLSGFDELRKTTDYITRTSAHFLVGAGSLEGNAGTSPDEISILQTQAADVDGTPFVASHLHALNYPAFREKKQYFVRALYELGQREPTIHSILQDWFDGPYVDANMRSLAIEMTGCNFDLPDHAPSARQVANSVGVIWALMKHYHIRASSLLGHHEIQLEKPDPGKQMISWLRCLLGARALAEHDPLMSELVFGQHLEVGENPLQAARIYLKSVRDFLVLVGLPKQVYNWEAGSGYWFLDDLLNGVSLPTASSITPPISSMADTRILAPFGSGGSCEGVDIHVMTGKSITPVAVSLVANGKCLLAGESSVALQDKQALFLHRQPDGAEVVSIYNRLSNLGNLQVGADYPPGYPVGEISPLRVNGSTLHFAIAYRSTWEEYLSRNPEPASTYIPSWVREHYLDPLEYLRQQAQILPVQSGAVASDL